MLDEMLIVMCIYIHLSIALYIKQISIIKGIMRIGSDRV